MEKIIEKENYTIYYDIPFDEYIYYNNNLGPHSSNWPVTYILYNKSESTAYIGETTTFKNRMNEHISNNKTKDFNKVLFIDYKKATKSTALLLESFLIRSMSTRGEYFREITNDKKGTEKSEYYGKENDNKICKDVWNTLKEKVKIAIFDYQSIIEKNEYKYSPYIPLNEEQKNVVDTIIDQLINNRNNKILINGNAGTGKTAIALHLFKLITDYSNSKNYITDDMIGKEISKIQKIQNTFCQSNKKYHIAFLTPTENFYNIIKYSIKKVPGLKREDLEKNSNFINNFDLDTLRIYYSKDLKQLVENMNDRNTPIFDLIIVDEAQRLNIYKNLSGNSYERFQLVNDLLGLPNNQNEHDGNQLDWIQKLSKNQIFFYDQSQGIRSSDIPKEYVDKFFSDATYKYILRIQERCTGGEEYINYVKDILTNKNPKRKTFKNYEFKICDSFKEMVELINHKKENGISVLASGVDSSMKKSFKIENVECIWNHTDNKWINRKKQDYEIGCIHVYGGVEADYLGVIIGNELNYDKSQNKIIGVKEKYEDNKGKSVIKNEDELTEYITNIYYILLTRGMKGTYLYIKNQDLKEYLELYIEKYK